MTVCVVCVSGFGHRMGGFFSSQPGSDPQRVHDDGQLAANQPAACPGVTLQSNYTSLCTDDYMLHRFFSVYYKCDIYSSCFCGCPQQGGKGLIGVLVASYIHLSNKSAR